MTLWVIVQPVSGTFTPHHCLASPRLPCITVLTEYLTLGTRVMDKITGRTAQIASNTQESYCHSLFSTHAQCYHMLGFTNFTCVMRHQTSLYVGWFRWHKWRQSSRICETSGKMCGDVKQWRGGVRGHNWVELTRAEVQAPNLLPPPDPTAHSLGPAQLHIGAPATFAWIPQPCLRSRLRQRSSDIQPRSSYIRICRERASRRPQRCCSNFHVSTRCASILPCTVMCSGRIQLRVLVSDHGSNCLSTSGPTCSLNCCGFVSPGTLMCSGSLRLRLVIMKPFLIGSNCQLGPTGAPSCGGPVLLSTVAVHWLNVLGETRERVYWKINPFIEGNTKLVRKYHWYVCLYVRLSTDCILCVCMYVCIMHGMYVCMYTRFHVCMYACCVFESLFLFECWHAYTNTVTSGFFPLLKIWRM